ncbi:radical SAM protein [Aminivibrio sp.]|uniref:radical SAM protein n=1 Tax=Aminivibrio sp. TaxID=1872489 RepID=UPI001A4FD9E1|nr:radical SAM protein [Aminivibrio sp.]MBL3539607.1 radical SAM protein [Aminivibrio sp.]
MKRLPFFLSMQSCPRRCVYCHQGEITGTFNIPSPEHVEAAAASATEPVEICFFGGSFTCIPHDRQKAYLEGALKAPRGSTVRLSTHPECLSSAVLALLARYPVSMIELGISSLDDHVLTLCNRGYSGTEVLSAVERVLDAGFHAGAQMMIGLPGQSERSSFEDLLRLDAARKGRPLTLRIYPCLVLRDTPLEELYRRGDYVPLHLDAAALWSGRLLVLARDLGIPVQRVGLQESATLSRSVVTGPHHPAFGELARAAELALTLAAGSLPKQWRVPGRARSLLTGHGQYGLRLLAGMTGLSQEETARRVVFCAESGEKPEHPDTRRITEEYLNPQAAGSVTGERLGGGCRLSSLTTAQAIISAPCVRRLPACETDIRVGFSPPGALPRG